MRNWIGKWNKRLTKCLNKKHQSKFYWLVFKYLSLKIYEDEHGDEIVDVVAKYIETE